MPKVTHHQDGTKVCEPLEVVLAGIIESTHYGRATADNFLPRETKAIAICQHCKKPVKEE